MMTPMQYALIAIGAGSGGLGRRGLRCLRNSPPPRGAAFTNDMQKIEMPPSTVKIRPATAADLDAVNRVIEAAVMTWKLPERVKRLSLPSYRYTMQDLVHLDMVLAEDAQHGIIGIAAWEPADAGDTPAGYRALLLHGIYVHPAHHHQGIGRELFATAEYAVRKHRYDGLLVKAQGDARGFFISQGMHRLPVEDPARHYAHRFWKRAKK
jgi:predicted N-acetyltransferase YhbS